MRCDRGRCRYVVVWGMLGFEYHLEDKQRDELRVGKKVKEEQNVKSDAVCGEWMLGVVGGYWE